MKKYFLDLFEYNNWANDKIILKLQDISQEITEGNPLQILSHIISVQDYWFERIKGKKSYNIFLWEEYSIQELGVLSLNSHNDWIKIITKLKDNEFQKMVNFKNQEGTKSTRSLQDIFQHVINHSTHHRGQINHILRINKIEPVNLDFIYYSDYCVLYVFTSMPW